MTTERSASISDPATPANSRVELGGRTATLRQRFVDRLLMPPFGDDIFVSYSRRDGTTYAAGLATELADDEFACRIDQWGTSVGEDIPDDLINALRRSAMLVVVGTAGAARSEHVYREIHEFKRTGRDIILIAFEGVRLKNGVINNSVYADKPAISAVPLQDVEVAL